MNSNTAHSPVFLVFPPEITVPEFQSTDHTATTYDSIMPFPKRLTKKMKILGTIQILFGLMNFSFGIILLFTFENPYPRFPFIFVSGYPFWSSVLIGSFYYTMELPSMTRLREAYWDFFQFPAYLPQLHRCSHPREHNGPQFINSGAFLVALERKTTETLVTMSRTMNCLSALAATAGIILLTFGFILDQHYFCGYSEEASQCQAITTLFIGILIMLMAFSIIELVISLSFSILRGNVNGSDYCEECC